MTLHPEQVTSQLQQLAERRRTQAAGAERVEASLKLVLELLSDATAIAGSAGLPLQTCQDLDTLAEVAKRAKRTTEHYRLRQLRKADKQDPAHG